MDVDLLTDALKTAAREGRLPAAILPTDVFGQSCDIDAILVVAKEWQIPVIIDAAESLGATYRDRMAGDGGFAGCILSTATRSSRLRVGGCS